MFRLPILFFLSFPFSFSLFAAREGMGRYEMEERKMDWKEGKRKERKMKKREEKHEKKKKEREGQEGKDKEGNRGKEKKGKGKKDKELKLIEREMSVGQNRVSEGKGKVR